MSYYEEVKLPRPLTKKEIYILYEKIKNGDKKAREEVIEHNILLVLKIANKYKSDQIIKDELISVGILGLIKGVDTFDTSTNHQFSTYVFTCINNEILQFLRESKKNIINMSMEESIGFGSDGNSLHLEDILSDTEAENNLFACEEQELINQVREAISSLSKKEQSFIAKRYGFLNGVKMTQRELSEDLGCTRSNVSRIEIKTIKKLRNMLNKRGVIEVNDNALNREKVKSKKICNNNIKE